MADSFVLRNGGDFILRNGSGQILRNPDVVAAPKKAISHVTIDAGVDLRKKKSKARTTQILQLTIEIPCTATAKKRQLLEIKTEGTAKIFYALSYNIQGTAKISQSVQPPITGSALSKQKTLASVSAEKSSEMYNMKRDIRKMRVLDTLKEALRSLDEDDK